MPNGIRVKNINSKIEEFSLLEKQLETDSYRQKFHAGELQDQILNLEPFKQSILEFKINYETMSEKELKLWLKDNIDKIVLVQNDLKISFKKLPFRLE